MKDLLLMFALLFFAAQIGVLIPLMTYMRPWPQNLKRKTNAFLYACGLFGSLSLSAAVWGEAGWIFRVWQIAVVTFNLIGLVAWWVPVPADARTEESRP